MPQRPAFRELSTMPRVIRAARFFWKIPRYTTSQIRADMRFPLLPIDGGRLVRPYTMPGNGCQCHWPNGLRASVGRRARRRHVGGAATVRAQHPFESVGRAAIERPAALAQLADDPPARLGRTVLAELELRPARRDLESHGGQLLERTAVERIVGAERPESALWLIAGKGPDLLSGNGAGIPRRGAVAAQQVRLLARYQPEGGFR